VSELRASLTDTVAAMALIGTGVIIVAVLWGSAILFALLMRNTLSSRTK
jgi:hypothetical protein